MPEKPLTASDLADALDFFWNAAIGESHTNSNIVGCIAVGFSAVATRLREISTNAKQAEEG